MSSLMPGSGAMIILKAFNALRFPQELLLRHFEQQKMAEWLSKGISMRLCSALYLDLGEMTGAFVG